MHCLEFNAPLRGIKKITEYKEYKYVTFYTIDMISIIFFIFDDILNSIEDRTLTVQKMLVNLYTMNKKEESTP